MKKDKTLRRPQEALPGGPRRIDKAALLARMRRKEFARSAISGDRKEGPDPGGRPKKKSPDADRRHKKKSPQHLTWFEKRHHFHRHVRADPLTIEPVVPPYPPSPRPPKKP